MQDYWTDWKPASCLPDCWCEAPRFGQLFVEPANTFSNVAYIFAAVLGLMLIKKREQLPRNPITAGKTYFYMFFLAMMMVALGSKFFHMSLTYWGQWVDVMAMYFIVTFFILYNLRRMKLLKDMHFVTLYFAINAVLAPVIYYYPEARRWLFGLFLILAAVTTLIANKKTSSKVQIKYFLYALASIIVAQISWQIDRLKIICDPHLLFNGHVVWHFLSAASGFYLFKYFATEEVETVEIAP